MKHIQELQHAIFKKTKRAGVSIVISVLLLVLITLIAASVIFFIITPAMEGSGKLAIAYIKSHRDNDGDGYIDEIIIVLRNVGTNSIQIQNSSLYQNGILMDTRDEWAKWSFDELTPFEMKSGEEKTLSLKTSINSKGELAPTTSTTLHVNYATPRGDILIASYTWETPYMEPWAKGLGVIAIYNDTNYPTQDITPAGALELARLLNQSLQDVATPLMVNANGLREYMENHQFGVVIMTRDVAPDTIFTGTASDSEFIEDWLEKGGTMIWMGHREFDLVGHSDGTTTLVGDAGSIDVLDIDATVNNANALVNVTLLGEQVLETFSPFITQYPFNTTVLKDANYEFYAYGANNDLADPIRIRAGKDAAGWFMKVYATSITETNAISAATYAVNLLKAFLLPGNPVLTINDLYNFVDLDGNNKVDVVHLDLGLSKTGVQYITTARIRVDNGTELNNWQLEEYPLEITSNPISCPLYTLDDASELINTDRFYIILGVDKDGDKITDENMTYGPYDVSTIQSAEVGVFANIYPIVANDTITYSNVSTTWAIKTTRAMIKHLVANGIPTVMLNDDLLKTYLINNSNTTLILLNDILPENVLNSSDDSLLEKYVESGGYVVFIGAAPFIYYNNGTHVFLTDPTGNQRGLKYLIDYTLSPPTRQLYLHGNYTVTPTTEGTTAMPSITTKTGITMVYDTTLMSSAGTLIQYNEETSDNTLTDMLQIKPSDSTGKLFLINGHLITDATDDAYNITRCLLELLDNVILPEKGF